MCGNRALTGGWSPGRKCPKDELSYIAGSGGAVSGYPDSFLFQINSAGRKASKERESSE